MPNMLQSEQSKEDKMEQYKCERLEKLIREQVIHALGEPVDLRGVQVRKLWGDHYRVNVIVGKNAASVRVANSYFLAVDSDGKLIHATPKIMKQH